jgi:hypothetical protein
MKKLVPATLVFLVVTILLSFAYFNRTKGHVEEVDSVAPIAAEGDSFAKDKNVTQTNPQLNPEVVSTPSAEINLRAPKPFAPITLTASKFRDVYSIASSFEDAIWLRDHGYPSTEQLRDYSSLTLGELEAKAKAGDLVAKVMAGLRLALGYKNPDGILLLQQAAVEGSVYALASLSSVYGTRGYQHDPVISEAYRRLALARGEYSLGELQPLTTMSPQNLARVEAEFLQLTSEYARARADRNLPPLQMEIRPGLEEYLNRLRELESVAPPSP